MKTKKVILFIVEGVTDKTSLGSIIDKLLSSNLVRFYIIGGDITSDRSSNSTNAVTKVNDLVKGFLAREIGIKKSDIIQIVHLIDMDGAYIESAQIQVEDVEEFVYSESSIIANSVERVVERNSRKQQVINRLSLCPKISGIPYSMYYLSCNLEHVLHNEINLADELKMAYAERFSDSYYKTEATFVDFIRDEKFAVKGDYKETWEFIKLGGNSLKRYSNFHLFFEQK
ncbi:MAG: hypothetical protein Q7J85_01685 [Bacillota bacterium]|nr:hypothetical protein [Bacillota bacterium]